MSVKCENLMVAPASPDCRLSAETGRSIAEKLKQAMEAGEPIVFTIPVHVYQRVNGVWQCLTPGAPAAEGEA